MPERAFVDSNVLVYGSGADHPLRRPCIDVINRIAVDGAQCWSSAEVLQELLHVFLRRGEERRAEATIREVAILLGERVVAVTTADVAWCLGRALPARLQARDRIHLAVMARLQVSRIISADVAFDAVPGIQRLAPENLGAWSDAVFGS